MMNWDSRKVQSPPEKSGQICVALLCPLPLHSPFCSTLGGFLSWDADSSVAFLQWGVPAGDQKEAAEWDHVYLLPFRLTLGCVPKNNLHFQGSSLYDPLLLGVGGPSLSLTLQLGGGKNWIISCPRTAASSVGSPSLLTSSLIVSLLNSPLMTLIWV